MYLTKEFHKVTNTVKFEGVNIQLTIPDVTAKFDNLINQDEARLRFENSLIHRYDTPNGIGLKSGDIIVDYKVNPRLQNSYFTRSLTSMRYMSPLYQVSHSASERATMDQDLRLNSFP